MKSPMREVLECNEDGNLTQILRARSVSTLDRLTMESVGKQSGFASKLVAHVHDVPQLVFVEGRSTGRRVVVQEGLVIGRDDDCSVALDDEFVSRRHAVVTRVDGEWFITDKSQNCTYVNGTLVAACPLKFGDRVRVGNTLLLFSRRDSLEENARYHQRLETLGRLGAGVAHDINNILASVLMNADMLALLFVSRESVSESERECVEDIRLAARRGADLAKRILDHSKAGTSSDDTNVDLGALVRDVIQLLRRTFGAGVKIEQDLAPGVIVRGNRGSLQQVAMNLLINARDALDGNGVINVHLRVTDTAQPEVAFADCHAVLSVQDNGKGIPADVQPHILEPYFSTKEGNGSGVGLATVSDVVRDHGGRLSFLSELGRGAVFTVTLPTIRTHAIRPLYTPISGIKRPSLPVR